MILTKIVCEDFLLILVVVFLRWTHSVDSKARGSHQECLVSLIVFKGGLVGVFLLAGLCMCVEFGWRGLSFYFEKVILRQLLLLLSSSGHNKVRLVQLGKLVFFVFEVKLLALVLNVPPVSGRLDLPIHLANQWTFILRLYIHLLLLPCFCPASFSWELLNSLPSASGGVSNLCEWIFLKCHLLHQDTSHVLVLYGEISLASLKHTCRFPVHVNLTVALFMLGMLQRKSRFLMNFHFKRRGNGI